ncbi:MAG: hypothetical protein M0Q26_05210 [Chitinophagaceae bacterium]|nr:hypothetical protein [Chitinophagaceae bacterium]
MAINKNHEFEELDGIKCAIVEKNVLKSRVAFIQRLLTLNHFQVVVVDSPPPKAAAPAPVIEGVELPVLPLSPETFTVGVTDVMFNTTNAIFGRLLKTSDGHVVTLSYWKQQEPVAHDEIPYYENK